jgi:ferrochelatase
MKKIKALVLLNMGAARSKDELKIFLLNMFNDKNILNINNKLLRSMLASIIVFIRHDKAWKNYKQIDGQSPLHSLTDELIIKLQLYLPDYYITTAMRYTSQFAQTAIKKIQEQNIRDVTLLPLYAQYSTTTTKSSLDDFILKANGKFDLKIIKPFYKNILYNKAIIQNITNSISKNNYKEYNLIFSAHGLPQKIIDNGDIYQKQIEQNVQILSNILKKQNIYFKNIYLAYQSKVGPMKWLKPSLNNMLGKFEDQNVLIYPISFIIDNNETIFELKIEYKELSQKLGINKYKVVPCINSNELFLEAIKDVILECKYKFIKEYD